MFLTGHDDMLEDGVRVAVAWWRDSSEDDVEEDPSAAAAALLATGAFPRSTLDALQVGVKYPDAPCARKAATPDGGVRLLDHRTCPLLKLASLLKAHEGHASDVASEAFASHRGALAHWHSMSAHPQLTVADVRARAMRQAMVFAYLSMRDLTHEGTDYGPSTFWLGQLAHMVQDAFSPSHVLRACAARGLYRVDVTALQHALGVVSRHRMVQPKFTDLSNELLTALVQRAAEDTRTITDPWRAIDARLRQEGLDPRAFVGTARARKYAVRLFLTIRAQVLAERAATREMAAASSSVAPPPTSVVKGVKAALRRLAAKDVTALRGAGSRLTRSADQERRAARADVEIVTYHCYNSQPPLAHASLDRLSAADDHGLLPHAVCATAVLLGMYGACVRAMAAAHGHGAGPKAEEERRRRAIRVAFLEAVRDFLAARVYRVRDGADALLTGFDVEEVVRELVPRRKARAG